jgi:hypothetical protein
MVVVLFLTDGVALMSLLGTDDGCFHVLVLFWGCNVINPCFSFKNTAETAAVYGNNMSNA